MRLTKNSKPVRYSYVTASARPAAGDCKSPFRKRLHGLKFISVAHASDCSARFGLYSE